MGITPSFFTFLQGYLEVKKITVLYFSEIITKDSAIMVHNNGTHIIVTPPQGDDYDIPIDVIKTPSDIDHWADHLSEKNWCTKDQVQAFRRIAQAHLNLLCTI